jgi:hypothetical protein
MNKLFVMPLVLVLTLGLMFGGCPTPAQEPTSAPTPTPAPSPTPTPSPSPPPAEPSAPIVQTPPPPPIEYTLKYHKKNEEDKEGVSFWTFGPSSLLIHFESPVAPFTIQKMTFLGWIVGKDTRNWAKQTFQLKIWEKFPDKELWAETYPYTDFNPTEPKWQEYEVPNIQVGETFSVEILPNAETTTVGQGTEQKRAFKCGLAIGVDYGAEDANSDVVVEGMITPWTESRFKRNPREKCGWVINIEGEGAPQE